MRIPRTRGAFSGLLLVLLGLWGGLIPFVGPYFDFTIGPSTTWDMTAGRFWLSVVPAIAVVVGGLVVMRSANRPTAVLGSWLALAGGVWFVIGQSMSLLWNHGTSQAGAPQGGSVLRAVEEIGWYHGLGAAITAIAGIALGRLLVVSVRDAERTAAGRAATGAAVGGGLLRRRRAAEDAEVRTGTRDAIEREAVPFGATDPDVARGEQRTGREPIAEADAGPTARTGRFERERTPDPVESRDERTAVGGGGHDVHAGRRRRGGLVGLLRGNR